MNDLLLIKNNTNVMQRLTSINGNIDVDKLIPSIWAVQVTDIKRILSDALYNKILEDFDTNTLTGIYLSIYEDYVAPMLVFYATSDFVKRNPIIIANGGNFKHTPENGVAADYKETDRQSKYYREMGAHFELEFYEFMKDKNVIEYKRDCVDVNTFKFPWYL